MTIAWGENRRRVLGYALACDGERTSLRSDLEARARAI